MRLIALCLAAFTLNASATPFVPGGDDEIVERLPARLSSPRERQQQRQARALLARSPASLPLALQLAREAIARARQWGDPRELGQAQAALAPWWALPDPPPAVRLLRATVRQSQHDFDAALQDLDQLLQQPQAPLPVRAQAELTRAGVLQVLGRWPEATQACERLAGSLYTALGEAVQTPAQACLAELASLQGQAGRASTQLQQLARQDPSPWLALVRAELAERRADPQAEALYRAALATPQPEVYALAAYADWLLDRRRDADVITLLSGRTDADALLLRLAIARRRAHDPYAARDIATLAARFDAASQRGDRSHAREQARFELDLNDRPAAALALAQAQWATQKEPADVLLLARSTQAAGQPNEALQRWARDRGYQDVRLAHLGVQP